MGFRLMAVLGVVGLGAVGLVGGNANDDRVDGFKDYLRVASWSFSMVQ